jgi:hypothetical protein
MWLANQTISLHLQRMPATIFSLYADKPANPSHFLIFKQISLPNQTISSHFHRYACQTKLPHIYTDTPAKPNCFLTFTQKCAKNQTISSDLRRNACQTKPFPHI